MSSMKFIMQVLEKLKMDSFASIWKNMLLEELLQWCPEKLQEDHRSK